VNFVVFSVDIDSVILVIEIIFSRPY